MNWYIWAWLSALFAGLTAILAKIGVAGVNAHLATVVRTTVVRVFTQGIAFATTSPAILLPLTRRTWVEPMLGRCLPWRFASLVLTLCSLSLGAATNSAWHFRAWQVEDGLPEHTIVGLEQTPDGYLWIATHRELCRFDGIRFQEFAPAMSTGGGAQIRAMLRDRRGRLWLVKDGGAVVCVEAGKVTQMLNLPEVWPGAQARAMAEDGEIGRAHV